MRKFFVYPDTFLYNSIMMCKAKTLSLSFILFLLVYPVLGEVKTNAQKEFELKQLDGQWSGEGDVIVPKLNFPLSIEGKATFVYDSTKEYLRTSIEGQKFYFTYSDSGRLYYYPEADSISWEIWDGFGEYGVYFGHIRDGRLTGTLAKDEWLFHIRVDFVSADSMVFNMTAQEGYVGKEKPQATINLWRQK